MLDLAIDILAWAVLGVVFLGIGRNGSTWVWSIKNLKENWSKFWPLTKQKNNCLLLWQNIKQKDNWLKLWHAIKRFSIIAITFTVIIALLWLLLIFGPVFIRPIHITNNVLLMGMIFLGWLIVNAVHHTSSEMLQEVTELKDKIAELELKLDEHLE